MRREPTVARLAIAVLLGVSTATLPARDYASFDIVGDSVSRGVNPEENSSDAGWVQMLFGEFGDARTIDELWPGIAARNSAVSGSKAEEWAGDDYAPMSRLLEREPELVVVFIGGNDMLAYAADGDLSEAEQAEYRANLERIVDRLLGLPSPPDIVVVNYYDLFDGVSEELPAFLSEYRFFSDGVATFNGIIADVATAKNCFLVDSVYSAFLNHCYGGDLGNPDQEAPDYVDRPLIPDFDIHPVTAGHEAIRAVVYETLVALEGLPDDEPPVPAPPTSHWLLY